jgi:hypothetical protein
VVASVTKNGIQSQKNVSRQEHLLVSLPWDLHKIPRHELSCVVFLLDAARPCCMGEAVTSHSHWQSLIWSPGSPTKKSLNDGHPVLHAATFRFSALDLAPAETLFPESIEKGK